MKPCQWALGLVGSGSLQHLRLLVTGDLHEGLKDSAQISNMKGHMTCEGFGVIGAGTITRSSA